MSLNNKHGTVVIRADIDFKPLYIENPQFSYKPINFGGIILSSGYVIKNLVIDQSLQINSN